MKKRQKTKEFPKKAKYIADGGFYCIRQIDKFTPNVVFPVMRRIQINTPEIDYTENMCFELSFVFDRVFGGYAEYRQVDCIKIKEKPTNNIKK